MTIVYLFRKRLPIYHSIEMLFANIQQALPDTVDFRNYTVAYTSESLCKIWKNCLQARKNREEVNHITGDIHYIALLLPKRQTVLTIHDMRSMHRKNRLKNYFIRMLWFAMPLRRVGYITTISESSKQELCRHFDVKQDKIHVIPNCVSPELSYQSKAFNNDCPQLLHLGATPNKNLSRVAEALREIKCHLHILGHTISPYKAILERYNIRYTFHCNLSAQAVWDLYKQADIVVFPSLYEGFGMPIIEAQTVGRPVVTSNREPMSWVAGDSALLVDPEKTDSIREAVQQLIGDEALREELVVAGRENAKRFSAEAVARQYVTLYQKIRENLL